MYENLELDKTYSINLKPNSILGNEFLGAVYQGAVSLSSIKNSINPNIDSIISALKEVDNIDTVSKTFLTFRVNDETLAVNVDWVSSVETSDDSLILTFNSITAEEKELILLQIKELGFYGDRLTIN